MTDLEERLRALASLACVSAEQASILLLAADVTADLARESAELNARLAAIDVSTFEGVTFVDPHPNWQVAIGDDGMER